MGNPELYKKLNTEMGRTMMGGTLYDVDEALGGLLEWEASIVIPFLKKIASFVSKQENLLVHW